MQEKELLVEHYHKTYDLTFSIWESRNRTLLILLAVVGFSTLLTFNVSEAQPLLVDIIAKLCGITDTMRIGELRQSFPYGIIQSIFIIIVFYLMLNLYHKTSFIRRSYRYLSGVEVDIRAALNLSASSVSFTREGEFYNKNRSLTALMTGLSYVLILGILLVSFLGMRLRTDFMTHQMYIFWVDLALTVGISYFFIAYSCVSFKK
ncbi:hypothetical protein [Xenorhabdus bovienii]|uniref:Uncharacterized protein n=1 Tax=Xenorhabdus bovienii TaxID=40576 RepID=A0AAJ1JB63_XENBV|nr:hypothetical protein [Xenorhabdus bovienii]MDE1480156.1 hypothetical protein [Xenorhabdus bovienii]MDE9452462.1 hypothetical protein [Xenorhabdus bovienii]MDE9511852.1 hypothetical protein [Xenorhabdus bovienii]MDE9523494.1 hypothetical protein [Xenorhabdus bovienii]